VRQRARHHLVFTKTALSVITHSEYGNGNAKALSTSQMLGQFPELHNAGVLELQVRSEIVSELL
jgi:hypothetical protein